VSVTVKFPFGEKVCVVVAPLPLVPSPKFHEYDAAFADPLASKLQFRDEQVKVKRATGAGAELVTVTDCVSVSVPFASVTVSTTV
jgi:hypothetical protein